jgi:hypothetical protein
MLLRRRLIRFFRRKKWGGSGNEELREGKKHTTTPAVVAEEHDHDREAPSIHHDDDVDKKQMIYVPQTVFCLVKDDLDKVSKLDQDEKPSSILATITKHDQDEAKSIVKSTRGISHQAYEDCENSIFDDNGKIGWIDRVPYRISSTKDERKTKTASLAKVQQWELAKISGISSSTYAPTYTEGTEETTSTRTSKEDDNCVGATVDELGAVLLDEMFPTTKKIVTSRYKGGIPNVISIGHQPVVMTPDLLLAGCFNPVQTAIDVGAAIDFVASRTFTNKHRQLENIRPPANKRTSRKRELHIRNGIEMCNADGPGGLDSFVMLSTATAGRNDRLLTLMENSIELAAPQTFSFNTTQRQLHEASRFHSRQRQLRGVRESGFTKPYAARGVDRSNVNKANAFQHGLRTRRAPASMVPFSQCAVLEATKSMTEESRDEFVFRNPHYPYMPGSVTAQSRW